MQKYYMREMSGRIKKGGYKNGRGYCGWYTNKDGRKMFLRSLKEYMYARNLDNNNFHFITEASIFTIDGINYKPDFFIYSDDSYTLLKKIIEIKDNKTDAEDYFKYESFFNSINIEYEVEYNVHRLKKYISKKEREDWVNNFVENYDGISVAGEDNPMYGMHHSDKTKKLIGAKTKEYMADPSIKKKHSVSIKAFWQSEEAKIIKEKYTLLRKKEKIERDKKLDLIDPIEERKCVICEKIFSYRKSKDRITCSGPCTFKYLWRTGKINNIVDGKKIYRIKILNFSKLIQVEENDTLEIFTLKVKNAKEKRVIPKNFSMSESVITRYFESFENLKKEMKNG